MARRAFARTGFPWLQPTGGVQAEPAWVTEVSITCTSEVRL